MVRYPYVFQVGKSIEIDVTGPAMQAAGCDQCHGSAFKVKGDGTLDPDTWPNSGIGRINPGGSKGSCSACHGRHLFSKAQARVSEQQYLVVLEDGS